MCMLIPREAVPGDVPIKAVKVSPASIVPSVTSAHTSMEGFPSIVLYVAAWRSMVIAAAVLIKKH